MKDKCPFCGAKRIGEPPELSGYACQFDSSGDFTRSMACKDRQIANLKSLLAECRDVMEILNINIPKPYRCLFCLASPITERHHPNCPHTKAEKLLPKLKDLGEICTPLFQIEPVNCWLGATITNQEDAEERIPELLKAQAKVRFVSVEPLLGPVDLRKYILGCCHLCGSPQWNTGGPLGRHCCRCDDDAYYPGINWLIIGAMTGPGAEAHQPESEWVQSLIDQARAAGVPVFLKKNLKWKNKIQEYP